MRIIVCFRSHIQDHAGSCENAFYRFRKFFTRLLHSVFQIIFQVTDEAEGFQSRGHFGKQSFFVVIRSGTAHGSLTLKKAFAQSCNSTFAILASELGDKALRRTAESFGIGDDFTFRDLVVENSAFSSSSAPLLGADLAWTGAGQNELALTPLHMCMIAAAVANDGVMMEPRLLLQAVTPAGMLRAAFEPIVYRTALPAAAAATVKEYMREVTVSGTGRQAAVSGAVICSKTGTAEIDTQKEDNAWYVGFIDDDSAPYAVCITVQSGGTGGSAAAPIARSIFRYLLGK